MSNDVYTPSVELTFFPRINFLKTFDQRANQRAENGRMYNWEWFPNIDDERYFEPADGSDCLSALTPFPVDLGADVTVVPTGLYDLREDCGSPTRYNLNPLIYTIDEEEFFPVKSGATNFSSVTLPHDLGPDVATTTVGLYDLREDGGSPTTISQGPLIPTVDDTDFYPAVSGSISISTETFPLDVGPDVTTTPVDTIDLRDDDGSASSINLNPLN